MAAIKKELDAEAAKIEDYLEDYFANEGSTSVGHKGIGTASISYDDKVTIKDLEAFMEYLEEQGEEDMIKATVHNKTLTSWWAMAKEEGTAPDPKKVGLSVYQLRKIKLGKG